MAKTILVVDDSSSLRQIVRSALVGAGYTVLEAADGQAALDFLDGRSINMTICDLNMPVLDGIEFVKAAKSRPNYKFMPIMMLTTETQDAKREKGREAGARAWMVKPFAPTQLIKAVDKICP